MRVPQVSERLKEVPAQALRGVFAGIGQLLLITDKLRNKAPAWHEVPRARMPEPAEPTAAAEVRAASDMPAAAEPAPAGAAQQRDFDKTGNVRLLGEQPQPPEAAPAQAVREPPEAAPAQAQPPEAPEAAPGPASPPLPNYDELTVASLRARLRNLSAEQVRQLASYEREHAGRAEVITMFERRIAKLESGGA
ncbi:MAG TPA: hypothetical protein VKV35_08235 [Streptosporangiaceae bacterium]|nr:hypothetical protein [Streptosporangiaceae bacterium]